MVEKALESVNEAHELFIGLGNRAMAADSLNTRALAQLVAGDFEGALHSTERARDIADEIGNLWNRSYAGYAAGYAHAERGDFGEAIAVWEEAMVDGERAGFVAVRIGPRADLAWLYALCGDLAKAREHVDAADALALKHIPQWRAWPTGMRLRLACLEGDRPAASRIVAEHPEFDRIDDLYPTSIVNWVLGRIEQQLLEGRPAEAARDAAARHAFWRRRGFVHYGTDLAELHGAALLAAGDPESAAGVLDRAIGDARSRGSRRTLWRLLRTRAAAHDARGRDGEADAARAESAAIVALIAASLERLGLADGFRATAAAPALR